MKPHLFRKDVKEWSGLRRSLSSISQALGLLTPGDWQSYPVAWSTASNPQPSLGDGTLSGYVMRNGFLAMVGISLVMGSTTTFGTGHFIFSLPTNAKTDLEILGNGYAYDLSGGTHDWVQPRISSLDKNAFRIMTWAGLVRDNVPFAWAAGDHLHATLIYPVTF